MSVPARPEWVGQPRVLDLAVDDAPMLANFAHADTQAVLAVEPRLAALAALVERAHLTTDDDLWSGVEQLAAVLVGPTRSATQVTPVTAVSVAVAGTLSGQTTRLRFMAALRSPPEVPT